MHMDSRDVVRYALVVEMSTPRCAASKDLISFFVHRSAYPAAAYAIVGVNTPLCIVSSVLYCNPHWVLASFLSVVNNCSIFLLMYLQ